MFYSILILLIGIYLRYITDSNFYIFKDSYKLLLISKAIRNQNSIASIYEQVYNYSDFQDLQIYKWFYPILLGYLRRIINLDLEVIAIYLNIVLELGSVVILLKIFNISNVAYKWRYLGVTLYVLSSFRIFWTGYITSDILGTFLLLCCIYVFIIIYKNFFRVHRLCYFLLGCLISLAFMTRPEMIILPFVLSLILIKDYPLKLAYKATIIISISSFLFSSLGYLIVYKILGFTSISLNIPLRMYLLGLILITICMVFVYIHKKKINFLNHNTEIALILLAIILLVSGLFLNNLPYNLITVVLFLTLVGVYLKFQVKDSLLSIISITTLFLVVIYTVFNPGIARYYLLIEPLIIILVVNILEIVFNRRSVKLFKNKSFNYIVIIPFLLVILCYNLLVVYFVNPQGKDYQQVIAQEVNEHIIVKELNPSITIASTDIEALLYLTDYSLVQVESFGDIERISKQSQDLLLIVDESFLRKDRNIISKLQESTRVDVKLEKGFYIEENYRKGSKNYPCLDPVQLYWID